MRTNLIQIQSKQVSEHLGDIVLGHILVSNGQLSAVIDFWQLGIGNLTYDLAISWTLLTGKVEKHFVRH